MLSRFNTPILQRPLPGVAPVSSHPFPAGVSKRFTVCSMLSIDRAFIGGKSFGPEKGFTVGSWRRLSSTKLPPSIPEPLYNVLRIVESDTLSLRYLCEEPCRRR